MDLCRWSLSLKNTGFSLLEVLLVLALAAVVSIVAVRYYSEVRQTQKITTFTTILSEISPKKVQFYTADASPNYYTRVFVAF